MSLEGIIGEKIGEDGLCLIPLKNDYCNECKSIKECQLKIMKSWLMTTFKMSRLMGRQNVKPKTINCFQELVDAGLKIKYIECK